MSNNRKAREATSQIKRTDSKSDRRNLSQEREAFLKSTIESTRRTYPEASLIIINTGEELVVAAEASVHRAVERKGIHLAEYVAALLYFEGIDPKQGLSSEQAEWLIDEMSQLLYSETADEAAAGVGA